MSLADARPASDAPAPPVAAPGRSPRPRAITGLVVVVPVHDEEDLLPACLRSIRAALDHPGVRDLPSRIVVALDACRDRSAAVAARELRPVDRAIPIEHRNVGLARSTGAAAGIAASGLHPAGLWLAHTDADSTVPRHWLARQRVLAATTDAVAGVVRVADWSPYGRRTRRAFDRRYRSSPLRPHPHVHGSNLGVRASSYLDVGGFPPQPCSEDHALWDALRAAGHAHRSSRRVWVRTSARRVSRTRGGFADTLADLDLVDGRAGR